VITLQSTDITDILKDIRSSPKILYDIITNESDIIFCDRILKNSTVSMSTAVKILNELCNLYDIELVNGIYIDYDRCANINSNALFCYNKYYTEIIFRSEKCITLKNIFHEFAHCLDKARNGCFKQTATGGKCNQYVPDTFGDKHIDLLEKMYIKNWKKRRK
jgi:hypothetical protein